jgi:hypothetical protein
MWAHSLLEDEEVMDTQSTTTTTQPFPGCQICKGRCKTFVFLCSMVAPELLEDIMGMSNSSPSHWTALNNQH